MWVVVVIALMVYLLHSVYISPWQCCTISKEDNALLEVTSNGGRNYYCRSASPKCILSDDNGSGGCDGGVCGGTSCDSDSVDSFGGGSDNCGRVGSNDCGCFLDFILNYKCKFSAFCLSLL